ncbi:MAG TPA: O-antigen ligase family protein [Chitinophagaceae bacterium]|nr:O-antigen ligase family protein [Chitinophagaceae bacterium]
MMLTEDPAVQRRLPKRLPFPEGPGSMAVPFFLFFAGVAAFAFTGSWLCFLPAFAALYCLLLAFDFKSAYWVLLCCVPLSFHVEFLNNSFSLSLPTEPLMLLFYLLAVMIILVRKESLPAWWLHNSITVVILLQFAWLIVAVCCSQVPVLSLKFLLSKSWYLVCFFLIPSWIIREKKDFRTVFIVLLLPLLLYMGIILVRHAGYGFRFYYIDAAVGSLFYKHVDYASVISMFFPFVLFAGSGKKGKGRVNYLLLVLALLFIVAIGLSYTRAAMGGLLFGFIVVLAIRFRLAHFIIPVFYILCLSLLFYFAKGNRFLQYHPYFQDTYMRHEFADHLKATVAGKDMSSVERLYRWIAALRMSADKPLTGFGPHSFYYYYKPYTLSAYRTYVSENYERSTTHNYFLYLMAEQGIPAMLLYAVLVLLVFIKAQRVYHRLKDGFYKLLTLAIAMSFAIFFVNNLFSELLETDKVGPMVYLLLAALVIIDHKSRTEPQPS